MSRYIDAYEVKRQIQKATEGQNDVMKVFLNAMYRIDKIPTADVRENVRGKWLGGRIWWKCNQCRKEIYTVDHKPFDFCPNCGADMRGDKP